jgi:hypothetical protein
VSVVGRATGVKRVGGGPCVLREEVPSPTDERARQQVSVGQVHEDGQPHFIWEFVWSFLLQVLAGLHPHQSGVLKRWPKFCARLQRNVHELCA